MKMDLEAIRQSPRQFVDLETVKQLSDRVMALEIQLATARLEGFNEGINKAHGIADDNYATNQVLEAISSLLKGGA